MAGVAEIKARARQMSLQATAPLLANHLLARAIEKALRLIGG
jgi:hypothetical protein